MVDVFSTIVGMEFFDIFASGICHVCNVQLVGVDLVIAFLALQAVDPDVEGGFIYEGRGVFVSAVYR